jgi:mannose-6-phosphate isomerase-like protein (cupin superfamily)
MKGGGLYNCTMPTAKTFSPVAYHRVKEIWYVLEGQGEVWRKSARSEPTVDVGAGMSLTISARSAFQFRDTGTGVLRILIVKMPPWPGAQEPEKTIGVWPTTVTANAPPAARGLGGKGS